MPFEINFRIDSKCIGLGIFNMTKRTKEQVLASVAFNLIPLHIYLHYIHYLKRMAIKLTSKI